MPTAAGVPLGRRGNGAMPPTYPPLPCYPGGPLNSVDWVEGGPPIGARQSELMRGRPEPLSWFMRRQIRGPSTLAQGMPIYLQSRPYSRGADAYSPHFGTINYNPIGAGVYAPYKLPVSGGPGARYTHAAIWFNVQAVPTSIIMNPTVPIETVNALIQTSSVGPSYLTTG